jgi:undecaprenyl-phosphate 4-deoxy-4-formamido-L-arabinose transferase
MPEFSVVIPVYRAAGRLEELYRRLIQSLTALTSDFEIILIEDCGNDGSWDIIREISSRDPRVKGVRLSRNFGQHAATLCGFSKAAGEWIITLDDDLEQIPEDIPKLVRKAREGYDLVYGIYSHRTHSWWRNLTSEIGRRMFKTAIPSLNYEYTSFRVIRQRVAKALLVFDSPFPFVDGYLSWVTNNYAVVPIEHGQRKSGGSNYTLTKLITHMVNIFVTFSDLPLRLASWLGITAFLLGIFWLTFIIIRKLAAGITISGYASLMAGILLFGGMQMLILGVFGQYLGRMNFKSSRKPLFLIAQETRSGDQGAAEDSGSEKKSGE